MGGCPLPSIVTGVLDSMTSARSTEPIPVEDEGTGATVSSDLAAGSSIEDSSSQALVKKLPPDLLLVVFIHGFKGNDSTFGSFPDRLRHVLAETLDNVIVESIVFPAYETKGELGEAVERFADWLVTLTVDREVKASLSATSATAAIKAKIVLCGHSMGGLLAADTLIQVARSRPDASAPLWPRIIALLAFDTPYFGLHPFILSNTATKAGQYVQTARDLWSVAGALRPKSPAPATAGAILPPPPPETPGGWPKWALPAAYAVGGTLIAGAAAGVAYMRRDDLGSGYAWATDHMKYVGNLWQEDKLRERVEAVLFAEDELGVAFRTWYTLLPPNPPAQSKPRTFIVLPKPPGANASAKATPREDGATTGAAGSETSSESGAQSSSVQPSLLASRAYTHFTPTRNTLAKDEISAHTGMFEARTNDGYYELGLQAARLIREVVMATRGVVEGEADQDERTREAGKRMEESMEHEEMEVQDTESKTTGEIGEGSQAAVGDDEVSLIDL